MNATIFRRYVAAPMIGLGILSAATVGAPAIGHAKTPAAPTHSFAAAPAAPAVPTPMGTLVVKGKPKAVESAEPGVESAVPQTGKR